MMNLNEAETCSTFDIKIHDWNSFDWLQIILYISENNKTEYLNLLLERGWISGFRVLVSRNKF